MERQEVEQAKSRIDELVERLNQASENYYNDKEESMSNFEWDQMYAELEQLETDTGYILPESPTQSTGIEESLSNGVKEAHEFPALSLAKTKKVEDLQKWAGERPVWISGKCDGATLVATYDNGSLTRLLTRGNGEVGTNLTFMAAQINGLPQKISEQGHFVVRGEATISYTDFEEINNTMDMEERYANPRNLVSGTLGLDQARLAMVKERNIWFNAFTLVYCEPEIISWGARMDYLDSMHFCTVERELTDAAGLPEVIARWTERVEKKAIDIPLDGLVITYDDTEYAATGSVTGHHATNAGLAFKWQDETAETVLDHVEWSCAVSTISPVAVFDEVQLEGTKVSRASLCNISEMKRLGIGADRQTKLTVIKANKIIPKCIKADAQGTEFVIPAQCPVCGADTEIITSIGSGTETLHCSNPHCTAKHVKKYERFVGKSGMDIDGLSVETIIKFINEGFIKDFADIYHISDYKEAIIHMDGFGEKSYENLIQAVEKSREVTPAKFITALCIKMIGVDAAKKIIKSLGTEGFFERVEKGMDFTDIEGIGPEKSTSIVSWFEDEENKQVYEKLLKEVRIEAIEPEITSEEGRCFDKTFVITGDVSYFKNRSEMKKYIEEQGGKVTGSVSKKTNYLVNNDIESSSNKNKKAKELGIPIITEEEFVKMFLPGGDK